MTYLVLTSSDSGLFLALQAQERSQHRATGERQAAATLDRCGVTVLKRRVRQSCAPMSAYQYISKSVYGPSKTWKALKKELLTFSDWTSKRTATLMNCKMVSFAKVEEVSSFIVNCFSNGAVYLKMALAMTLIRAIMAGAPYFTILSTSQVRSQISQYCLVLVASMSVNVVDLKLRTPSLTIRSKQKQPIRPCCRARGSCWSSKAVYLATPAGGHLAASLTVSSLDFPSVSFLRPCMVVTPQKDKIRVTRMKRATKSLLQARLAVE